MKGLSLFANVGVAETYLENLGIDMVLANEIDPKRAKFYKHLYPSTEMIEGDITDNKIYNKVLSKALDYNVNFVIATPPCQGMSTAGKKNDLDPRNQLVSYAIDIIKELKPAFVLLENVPQQLKTKIEFDGEYMLIPKYIKYQLEDIYLFNNDPIIDCANYGVPQTRQRSIFLLTRKDIGNRWEFPKQNNKIVTLKEAIGDLPSLDPLIYDVSYEKHLSVFPEYEKKMEEAEKVSKWHTPPKHIYRQVMAMRYTPTGKSAFQNEKIEHRPHTKDGRIVKGYKNTYKRQSWDRPAYTVTMYNRTIGSQDNVHPGRPIGLDNNGYMIYSDPRVLTIYELLKVMSLPTDWNIPEWASEHFIRQVIGEGIPPLLVKQIVSQIVENEEFNIAI